MITEYDNKIDKVYDKNFNPINFDYQRYVRIAERINNDRIYHNEKYPQELKAMITRDKYKNIPDGVYYYSNGTEKRPHMLFLPFDIYIIGGNIKSSNKDEIYTYLNLFHATNDYIWYGVRSGVIAFYDNYYFGYGADKELARQDLENNLFDIFRNKILQMASNAKEKEK